ncbi:MAG: hypothetical protein FWC70_10205 [Defluviitaleaceae bacterium]|nr:hypothetical protein [Defluviitaleaceae bacterium]
MAAISQIVDEQIKQIRKERAELDELRESLEKREDELSRREQDPDIGVSDERRESMQKEVEDLTAELKRLRDERDASIESFGGEISKVHAEKTSESESKIKQLHSEIAFLAKGKIELEEEVEKLQKQRDDMAKDSQKEVARLSEEKDAQVSRVRDEREATLKEINLEHVVAVAELDRAKKELEIELAELENTKAIEWKRLQAELSRHKTTQTADLDAEREAFLADFEKERATLQNELRANERECREGIAKEKREWQQELLRTEAEKQMMLDEIKALQYEHEKIKSEFIIKTEKNRRDEERIVEAKRAEATVSLEEELAVLRVDYQKESAEEKSRLRDELAALKSEISAAETKKSAVNGEIIALEARFEQRRAENENTLEIMRLDRLKETDEKCVARLTEIESLRQVRIAALESAYLEKASALEQARAKQLDECMEEIKAAEAELATVKKERAIAEKGVAYLRAETKRIEEENEALLKTGITERRIELEKMTSDKMVETDKICEARISAADERVRKIEEEGISEQDRLSAEIAESTESLLQLRRMVSTQKVELEEQKAARLEEIEQSVLETLEVYSKMKTSKMSEIDKDLDEYKRIRMEAVQADISRQTKAQYKQLGELATILQSRGKKPEPKDNP